MLEVLVIGLIGSIGSGKTIISKYLVEKHGFKTFSVGDYVRRECEKRGLELSRSNLEKISKEFTDKHGSTYWIKKVVSDVVKSGFDRVLIDGIRREEDVIVARETFGNSFKLIKITAPAKVRFERLLKRGRPGDPKTFEEFKKQEQDEKKLYHSFNKALELSDFEIVNNDSLKKVEKQVDKIVSSLL